MTFEHVVLFCLLFVSLCMRSHVWNSFPTYRTVEFKKFEIIVSKMLSGQTSDPFGIHGLMSAAWVPFL